MNPNDRHKLLEALNKAYDFLPFTSRDVSFEQAAMVSIANSLYAIARAMNSNKEEEDDCVSIDVDDEVFSYLSSLKAMLFPSLKIDETTFVVCHLAARYLLGEFDRDKLPDWVAVLAGASLKNWKAAYEEVWHEFFLK